MRNPLSGLDRLRSCAECHKVALHDMLPVLRVQPKRQWPRKMIRVDDVVAASRIATGVIHPDGLSQ